MNQTTQRWLEHWATQESAEAFFRQMWKTALNEGLRPGDAIASSSAVAMLAWLVRGHPEFEEMSRGSSGYWFTIRPDGRGNHRFVLVTTPDGVEHPFSTRAALTGVVRPLRHPEPLKGITS